MRSDNRKENELKQDLNNINCCQQENDKCLTVSNGK